VLPVQKPKKALFSRRNLSGALNRVRSIARTLERLGKVSGDRKERD
jgi:hypothetical protein